MTVTTVPPSRLAEAIDARTDVVAFSAVQMSTGEVADLDAIVAAAEHHGALTLLDATQACGWLPVDANRFGAVVCSAYKWLMSPRGTAFMAVGDEWLERIVPHSAGWYAGADVHESYFGPPLRLASDARRLDTSPAWFSWVGTQPALDLLNRIGIDERIRPRCRSRQPLPRRSRHAAVGQRDRLGRPSRRRRAPRARGHRRGAARRPAARLVARLQHRRATSTRRSMRSPDEARVTNAVRPGRKRA